MAGPVNQLVLFVHPDPAVELYNATNASESAVLTVLGAPTVNTLLLVAVLPPTVTVTKPVVAPAGTLILIVLVVDAEGLPVTPLNFTILLDGIGSKFVPPIITKLPIGPLSGFKKLIVGLPAGITRLKADNVPLPIATMSFFPSPS